MSTAVRTHNFRPGSARAAFAYPDFRRMWVGSFASNIGTWMQNVVLPAYVFQRTGRASVVALLAFAQLGPMLLLSIPAGEIADRVDRRRWLISMQLVQLVFSAALAPLAAANAPIIVLFLFALGVGSGNALNAPAWSAMLPTLVDRDDLAGAIAMNSALINGSRVIGPIIVAVLTQFGVTTSEVFAINAATYLFVVIALLSVRLPNPPPREREAGLAQFTSGLRLAGDNPVLRRLLLSIFFFAMLSLPFVSLFPAIAKLNFGIAGRSAEYKWLYATWGLGACLGGLAVGTIFTGWDPRRLVRLGFGAFAVSMTGFALAREGIGAFTSGFFLGFAFFGTTTAMTTILQSRLKDNERGRILALWLMAWGGTMTIGNLILAPIIDNIGARWVLLVGAVTALVLAFWCDIAAIDRAAAVEPPIVATTDPTIAIAGE